MKKQEFESILTIKIQDIVSLIMETKDSDFESAVKWLYSSKTYKALTTESTKLWHLSSAKILDILEQEQINTEVNYPDFV